MECCKKCKTKDCEYRGLCIDGYIIYTTEHCCKNEVETARKVITSDEYKKLQSFITNMSQENKSGSLLLFESQMKHFENMAFNKLVVQ